MQVCKKFVYISFPGELDHKYTLGPVDYFNKWFLVKEKPEGQGQESLAEEEQESAAAEEQQQPPAQQVDMRNIAEHCATVRFLRDHEEF